MWILILGVALHAFVLVALATLIAGGGGGVSYLAGLNIVNTVSPPDQRAGTLSLFLVACYLGFSIPALAVGTAATNLGLFAAFVAGAVVLGAIALTVMFYTTERNLMASPGA
jgi:hypothetical protein